MTQIAGISYPKYIINKQSNRIKTQSLFDNGNCLELDVEGIFKDKFLFSNENLLIVRKNNSTFKISKDNGISWQKEKTIPYFKIFHVYPLSNGNYLVGGLDKKQNSLIYLLDNNLD